MFPYPLLPLLAVLGLSIGGIVDSHSLKLTSDGDGINKIFEDSPILDASNNDKNGGRIKVISSIFKKLGSAYWSWVKNLNAT